MAEERREEEGEALPPHHVKVGPCFDRKRYRDGRRKVAVKAYGVFRESRHLLVFNVPSIGVEKELETRLVEFGRLDGDVQWLHDGPGPMAPFTSTAHACYERMTSARLAKRRLDDFSFFGSALHVSYAPEFETVAECRLKLFLFRKSTTGKFRRFVKETTERLAKDAGKDRTQKEEDDEEEGEEKKEKESLAMPRIELPDLRFPPPVLPSNCVAAQPHPPLENRSAALTVAADSGKNAPPKTCLGSTAESGGGGGGGTAAFRNTTAFSSSVLVLHQPPASASASASRLRFLPRQLGPQGKKARLERPGASYTVADLKKDAVTLGQEQGPQIDRDRLMELRARSSVTLDPGMERSRKEIAQRLRQTRRAAPRNEEDDGRGD